MTRDNTIEAFFSLLRAGLWGDIPVQGEGFRVFGQAKRQSRANDYEIAKRVLVPLASEVETEYVGSKHLGMTINGWVVELHGSLRVGLPNKINRVLDDIKSDTFNRGNVRSWINGRTQVFLLGKENDIVYVFVHFFNHFYKEGVGLRQLCDWCRLLWTYRDEIDVKKIEGRIQEMGLVSEWKAFYNLASRYLGMPDLDSQDSQARMSDQRSSVRLMVHDSRFDKKADRIMEFILKSGNMGQSVAPQWSAVLPVLPSQNSSQVS